MAVNCVVVDARIVYGKTQIKVTPVAGDGEEWFDLDGGRVIFVSDL